MPELTTNKNFLSPLSFQFSISKTPNVNFFVTACTTPSVNLGVVEVANPFSRLRVPGDKIDFGDFSVTFKVDEDMRNYEEILEWMFGLGFPNEYAQYRALNQKEALKEGKYSDATLTILTSSKNPNKSFVFTDAFPYAISDIRMASNSSDVEYVECEVSFKYTTFSIKDVE